MAVNPATVHTEFGTGTSPTERQVRQVRNNIARVYPESTPFYALLDRTAKVTDIRANKYEWQRISEFPRTVTLAAAEGAADTSLVISDATAITESQILQDPVTGEQILVLSKAGNTLTVATRGSIGGGNPADLPIGKELFLLGTAREEGATRLSAVGITPEFDFNYSQQFEKVTGITDRAANIMYYGPNQRDLDAMEVMNEYKKQMERQFLFGYRKVINAGSSGATTHPRYIMGGCREFIEGAGNMFDAGGAFTYQEFCDFMKEICRFGRGNSYFAMGSLDVINIMNRWPLAYHQADHMRTPNFGLEVTNFKGPKWRVMLVHNEQFEEQDEYASWLMILNANHVRHHIHRGLPDTVNKGITGPKNDGDHTIRDQITGTHTLEIDVPMAHCIIGNITS